MRVLITRVQEYDVEDPDGGPVTLDQIKDSMLDTINDEQHTRCETSDEKLYYIPGSIIELSIKEVK